MEFKQINKHGENKILIQTNGDFIDQSQQVREYIVAKDNQQKISNLIAVMGIVATVLIAIFK